jgi:hypothetical protein
LTCCICEDRDSTFDYLEGTPKARGICAFCLQMKFHDQLENFKVYVFGRPDVPEHVEELKSYVIPDGEIRIALDPAQLIANPGITHLTVSTAKTVAAEVFPVLHGSLNPVEPTCTPKMSATSK